VNFALRLWNIITIVVEIFGGILVLISFFGLRKETRELMKLDDEEFIPEEVTSNLIYYLNIRIVGIIIAGISGLARIFMR
jgi:hypothetical protein